MINHRLLPDEVVILITMKVAAKFAERVVAGVVIEVAAEVVAEVVAGTTVRAGVEVAVGVVTGVAMFVRGPTHQDDQGAEKDDTREADRPVHEIAAKGPRESNGKRDELQESAPGRLIDPEIKSVTSPDPDHDQAAEADIDRDRGLDQSREQEQDRWSGLDRDLRLDRGTELGHPIGLCVDQAVGIATPSWLGYIKNNLSRSIIVNGSSLSFLP